MVLEISSFLIVVGPLFADAGVVWCVYRRVFARVSVTPPVYIFVSVYVESLSVGSPFANKS